MTETLGHFILTVIVFALAPGLIFGSFANVVIYRLPKKISIIKPPSACQSCGKRLGFSDLVPVFSWIFLRGRCRFCTAKISPRYPLVELICGFLFVSMAYHSPTLSAIPLFCLAFVLLTVSFIDWDTREIPDGLLIFGGAVGVLWVLGGRFFPALLPYSPSWQDALLGALVGGVPIFLIDKMTLFIVKKDGFGYGDVKLMIMTGVFLGWQANLMALVLAVLSGAAYAVYLLATGKAKRGAYIAFGPFLCGGAVASLLFGNAIISAYAHLFAL